MVRQRLSIAIALSATACAQIAGFEQLNSQKTQDGGSGTEGAGTPSTSGSDGANAGRGPVSGSAGESVGTSGSGGKVDRGSSGSGGDAAGATNGGGNGGTGNGGSAGSVQVAGAAGAPVTGSCNAQLFRNPDFDSGPAEWRQESRAPGILEVSDLIVETERPALREAGVKPQSGNYLAWLGGVLDPDRGSLTNLLQDIQIPAKVSRLVLSGWIQIKTTEPNPADTRDQLDLALQDDNNFWSFHFWKGTEVTNGWQPFSYEIADGARLDALRGRTLTFYAEALADTTEVTSFWLDSISLIAECPR